MKRVIAYAALILAAFFLQNNLFAACPLIRTVPNLFIILTFTFGFLRDSRDGMLIGFFSGLLMDAFFGGMLGFYALIYLTIGFISGLLGRIFYREYIFAPVFLSIFSDFSFCFLVYIFGFLIHGSTDFGGYFVQKILPEIIYTTLVTIVVYKPLQKLNQWLEDHTRRNVNRFA